MFVQMLPSPDSRLTADHRTPVTGAAGDIHRVGVYLTNGVFLYRLVHVAETESGEMVDIEDCYGLEVVRVPWCDLLVHRLRVVTPA